MEKPTLRIVKGGPTDDEAAAVDAAVTKIWLEDRGDSGLGQWVLAARMEATGRGSEALPRAPGSWRLSGRVPMLRMTHLQTGRGDAK